MMVNRRLDLVHQRITIEVEDNGSTRSYRSRIESVVGERLVVAMPMEKERYVPFTRGQMVTVYLDSRALVYRYFETEVTGTNLDPTPVLLLRLPNEIKRLERRQHTRVEVYIVPKKLSLLENGEEKQVPATIVNLSGGGLMFQHDTPLPKDTRFETVFELPGGFGLVQVSGQVVRSVPYGGETAPVYGLGAAFTGIRYSHRENIIKFILHQQAQLIRQGII